MEQLVGKQFNMYIRLFNYKDANETDNGSFIPHYDSFFLASLDEFILSQPAVYG